VKRGEGGQNTSDPTGPDAISEYWKQARKVVVTGCCGTLGRRLVRRLLDPEYVFRGAILGIDNNEDGIFRMEARWTDEPRARFLLGDVRDQSSLRRLFAGADTVLHCAAYKHVYQCEKAPFEAMRTNILGVESVIQAASEVGVSRVLFTSSDKAVNPTNVMGTSKLMGERLITAANANGGGAVFASTRFGNVLGSRGSVTEIFASQIARGGPLTLTSSEMTRFVMSIDEAVRLVLSSVPLARGGEVFITKMPVVSIHDLARVMIQALASGHGYRPESIEVIETGPRPGEKLMEELMTESETMRTCELRDFFVVLPAFRPLYQGIVYDYPQIIRHRVDRPYVSRDEPRLDPGALRRLLEEIELIPAPSRKGAPEVKPCAS
jgi:FlaA1/EpsC-like NDP-sugar epimerase